MPINPFRSLFPTLFLVLACPVLAQTDGPDFQPKTGLFQKELRIPVEGQAMAITVLATDEALVREISERDIRIVPLYAPASESELQAPTGLMEKRVHTEAAEDPHIFSAPQGGTVLEIVFDTATFAGLQGVQGYQIFIRSAQEAPPSHMVNTWRLGPSDFPLFPVASEALANCHAITTWQGGGEPGLPAAKTATLCEGEAAILDLAGDGLDRIRFDYETQSSNWYRFRVVDGSGQPIDFYVWYLQGFGDREGPSRVPDCNCDIDFPNDEYGICWYYAQYRALYGAYNPSSCPENIGSSNFQKVSTNCAEDADIITWGGHAAYIADSSGDTIEIDDYNFCGSCNERTGVSLNPPYSAGCGSGAASWAWVRRPSVPSPVSPAHNTTVPLPVTIDWSGSASVWWLQVATDASFNNMVFEDDTLANSIKTLGTGDGLQTGVTYHWRVLSGKGDYCGTDVWSNGASSTRKFTTSVACSSVGTPTIYATIESGHPKIYWSSVSGADQYKIYRAYNTYNSTYYLIHTNTPGSDTDFVDTSYDIFGGGCCKLYLFYKVKAVNNNVPSGCDPDYLSSFSNYQQFTVEDTEW